MLSLKKRIKEGFLDVFWVWKDELKKIFHDTGVVIFFIVVPLAYPLIYSFIYNNEAIHDVPVAVVDDSRTPLSREYLRHVDATPDVRIESYCSDMEEAKLLMREHKAHGIIYISPTFSKDIVAGRQTYVNIFCDMSALMYYKAILMANSSVSLDMGKDIKLQKMVGATERQQELITYPIAYENVALFNPTNGFASYLLPSVLMLIIQQTLLLGIGLQIGTERTRNRFSDLIPINKHYNGVLRIVGGKALCYFLLYAVMSTYMMLAIPEFFNLIQIIDWNDLALFMLPYILACIFFAMTMSVFIKSREAGMMVFVFTSVPLLFLSGISWPGSAIPAFWRWFSYIFPSTFGINGYVKLNTCGATLNEVSSEYMALWGQVLFYFCTTCIVYRYHITQSRHHIHQRYVAMRRLRSIKSRNPWAKANP